MIHLVTGAARAGKSRFALTLAEAVAGPIDFIATAQALDPDMGERIRRHREERGPRYRTVEAPVFVGDAVRGLPDGGAIVLDCLTMWVANLVFSDRTDAQMNADFEALAAALLAVGGAREPGGQIGMPRREESEARPIIVVTNEVGWGIVPADALSRRYRDQLGRCNQRIAAVASAVSLLVAGIPMKVK